MAADNLISESDFAQSVVEYARATGWLVWRTWNSKHSPAGEPDLRLVHPGQKRVIWAELKSSKGKLTPMQEQAIETLQVAGAEAYLWYPQDWWLIEMVLKGEYGTVIPTKET